QPKLRVASERSQCFVHGLPIGSATRTFRRARRLFVRCAHKNGLTTNHTKDTKSDDAYFLNFVPFAVNIYFHRIAAHAGSLPSLKIRVLPPANSYTAPSNPRLMGAAPRSRPRTVSVSRGEPQIERMPAIADAHVQALHLLR